MPETTLMPSKTVVLINSNRMKPPIGPLALDYIGGRLAAANLEVDLIDLSFSGEPEDEIRQFLSGTDPVAVGITLRNTDDCFWPSCAWFVPELRRVVELVRANSSARIVLGGCGFSIFPRQIMDYCGVDLGVVGDGEDTFLTLVRRLRSRSRYRNLPGLVWRGKGGEVSVNPPRLGHHLDLPVDRRTIDNARYFEMGGMGNIETKRGCPNKCIYCADPIVKGETVRCRDPRQVADEIESLLAEGVDVLHLCDAEFNVPSDHAMAVCEELIARGLGERVRWYCYATVQGFSTALASAMRRAGCVGINFGVDSACDRMLESLGRGFRREAIRDAVKACRRAGLTVMLDLLVGGPGEDPESVAETIAFIKSIGPDRAGAATGVRLYPGTSLARMVATQGPLEENPNLRGDVDDNDGFFRPIFYIDRRLGDDPTGLVRDMIGDDPRFFKPTPPRGQTDYNYNDNSQLEKAIGSGHRGAYWDILRRLTQE